MSDEKPPPPYIVIAGKEVDRLTAKLAVYSSFRVYTDDFELVVEPSVCAPDRLYAINRAAVQGKWAATGQELDKLLVDGELDDDFKTMDANVLKPGYL